MRHKTFAVALVVSLGLLWLSSWRSAAAPWPRFRGPNGTGASTDQQIPVHWTEENGVLWKIALPGVGNSSPIVWGDRLFLETASKDCKERALLCINVPDGKILWSRTAPGHRATTHAKNSLASSTPATDGERVYAVFWDGSDVFLNAYDFQGNPTWQRNLGQFKSQHGAGVSPIVYRGKVFLAFDQDGAAEFDALDARTGKPVWQVPRVPYRACYSTPLIVEHADADPELMVVSTGGITSYHPDTGAENWNFTWPVTGKHLRTVASPVYSAGMLFATSGDGDGSRHAIAIRASGKGDVSGSNLVWQEKKMFPYVPTMLTHGKYLFYINDHGRASCHVAATGEEVWTRSLCGSVFASPILVDGKIYAIAENGTVIVFEAGPTFKLLARNPLGEAVLATPAVADNRLFIRGIEHLYCIGKPPEKQTSAR
jgi:outer membrane protein assembly factor BamB